MVGKGSTEEVQQTAHEARRIREKRKRYEALLEEHPAVKAARAQITPRAEKKLLKRGVPKLIAEALQETDTATAVAAGRRVMKYHRRIGNLVSRRLKRETIPLKEQEALIRQGEDVERDFWEMLRSAARALRANPLVEAYTTAIAARPHDTEIIDNLTSFFSQSEWAAIRYIGIEPPEFIEHWDQLYRRNREKAWELLTMCGINRSLERLERYAERVEFPDSPRYLTKKGIITLSGDGPVLEFVYDASVALLDAVTTTVEQAVTLAVVAVCELGAVIGDLVLGTETMFTDWHDKQKDEGLGWMEGLPPCPCSLPKDSAGNPINPNPDIWSDPKEPLFREKYHPDAEYDIRSKSNDKGAGQQCCYKKENGEFKLITSGASAGTPDKVHPELPLLGDMANHHYVDVRPFDYALELDNDKPGTFVDRYLEVRPPNKGAAELSVKILPEDAGSVTPPEGVFPCGTEVTLIAEFAFGYAFDCWSGDASGVSRTLTIIMSGNKNIVANFEKTAAPEPIPKPTAPVIPEPVLTAQPITELYIANRSSMELHRSDCFWVTQMKDSNKMPSSSLEEVAELVKRSRYNGCFYCLPRYDRDRLTAQQVLANLEEDLRR